MACSATPELAAAVSNAGGLGSLGCGEMSGDQLEATVERLRTLTNRPFNLNFFAHPAPAVSQADFERVRERLRPYYQALSLSPPTVLPSCEPGFDETRLQLILELRPQVISFHFGLPGSATISSLKEAGILILSTATTVAEASYLASSGVDAIIAQGYEAGGHRGSHQPKEPWDGVGLMSLLPQVVDAVDQPVIAAGGIADGRGIAAALALGASGVQMGTAFLSCPEAGTDQVRRAMLRTAKDTDTMMTDAFSGRAARARAEPIRAGDDQAARASSGVSAALQLDRSPDRSRRRRSGLRLPPLWAVGRTFARRFRQANWSSSLLQRLREKSPS